MRNFVIGLVLGIFLGSSAGALAAGVFGSGYLSGWSVTKDGKEVCSDAYVYGGSKEIECD